MKPTFFSQAYNPTLRKLGQKNCEIKNSLGHIVSSRLDSEK